MKPVDKKHPKHNDTKQSKDLNKTTYYIRLQHPVYISLLQFYIWAWSLLTVGVYVFLQSADFTRAMIFPSHSGNTSLSSVTSSCITIMSKSSHSVLKKYLEKKGFFVYKY